MLSDVSFNDVPSPGVSLITWAQCDDSLESFSFYLKCQTHGSSLNHTTEYPRGLLYRKIIQIVLEDNLKDIVLTA